MRAFLLALGIVGLAIGVADLVLADRMTAWFKKPRNRKGWRAWVKPVPGAKRDTIRFGLVEVLGSLVVLAIALSRT